jgi:hypothetical protein
MAKNGLPPPPPPPRGDRDSYLSILPGYMPSRFLNNYSSPCTADCQRDRYVMTVRAVQQPADRCGNTGSFPDQSTWGIGAPRVCHWGGRVAKPEAIYNLGLILNTVVKIMSNCRGRHPVRLRAKLKLNKYLHGCKFFYIFESQCTSQQPVSMAHVR